MNLNITEKLEAYTAAHSNFDTSRDYISMSHASSTVEEMINTYKNGFEDSLKIRLRCYKGYQMEKDLVDRIVRTFPAQVTLHQELTAFGGIVKGHPDFNFDLYPGDVKAVPLEEHLPGYKLPRRVYSQVQAYMLYGKQSKALVVYEARDSGKLQHYWIEANPKFQKEIDDKFRTVIKELGL